jgi:hypothetical protein
MAPLRHTSMQLPQSMHSSSSTWATPPRTLMALVGQTFEQVTQPTHFVVSVTIA